MASKIQNMFTGMFGLNQKRPTVTPYKEQGSADRMVYGGWILDREKKQNLTFLQRSNTYEEIISNIAIVGASIRYFMALATTAKWTVKPAEKDTSEQYSEFAEKLMVKMDNPWSSVIRHSLMAKFLGFSVQEWTAFRDEIEGTIYYKSIENRPQRTIVQFDTDAYGNVLGFGQQNTLLSSDTLYIPRKKTLYMVDDMFTDSPAGMGVLRHLADSSERLDNYHDLEKQGFEKDLKNIPIGRVPYQALATAVENGEITEERAKALIQSMEDIVKMSRKSNTTGLLLDSAPYISKTDTAANVSTMPQWDLTLLGNGRQSGAIGGLSDIAKAIERLQIECARVIGTDSLMLSGGGSQALSSDKSKNLYLMVNAALSDVKFQANKDLIDPFWKLNGFPDEMKPRFEVEEVNEQTASEIAAVLRDMATAGATLAPDDEVINDVRNMLGVSTADLEAAAKLMVEEKQKADESHAMEADSVAANIMATEAKAKQKPMEAKK